MWTKHLIVIGAASELRVKFRTFQPQHPPPDPLPPTRFSSFPTDRSNSVAVLLQFVFVCASVMSHEAFVLLVFVPHLAFFWSIGRGVLCNCGISWVSSLIFFYSETQWLFRPFDHPR